MIDEPCLLDRVLLRKIIPLEQKHEPNLAYADATASRLASATLLPRTVRSYAAGDAFHSYEAEYSSLLQRSGQLFRRQRLH